MYQQTKLLTQLDTIHITDRIHFQSKNRTRIIFLMLGVSEWLSLTAFFRTAGSEVHVIHISDVIIDYTWGSLSSLTNLTHNLQVAINIRKKNKIHTKKSVGTYGVGLSLVTVTPQQFTITLTPN